MKFGEHGFRPCGEVAELNASQKIVGFLA